MFIFQDSLRRYHVVRFYVQEKEDPHDHAVFVGNLPVSLAQRQYERILLKLLGAKGMFSKKWYLLTHISSRIIVSAVSMKTFLYPQVLWIKDEILTHISVF